MTRDAGWPRAFHAVVPPLLREFRPQVLVSQHGCDSHRDDPLTNLELTIDAPRTPPSTGSPTRSQAAAGCSPGGGGYEHVHVGLRLDLPQHAGSIDGAVRD